MCLFTIDWFLKTSCYSDDLRTIFNISIFHRGSVGIIFKTKWFFEGFSSNIEINVFNGHQ